MQCSVSTYKGHNDFSKGLMLPYNRIRMTIHDYSLGTHLIRYTVMLDFPLHLRHERCRMLPALSMITHQLAKDAHGPHVLIPVPW